MKLRTILAGTAVAALALATDLGPTSGLLAVPQAEAATNVSISLFYNELGNHGDWVRRNDAYVFIPANVRSGWQPYTVGRWVYAENVGWTWASDEPFGWATYHYGRWGYADDIGWHWVPGTRWAPAWVSWRRSNDYVVWAPLPPARGGRSDADLDIDVVVDDIPAFFWVAVPTRRFLDPNIRSAVLRDNRELRRVVQRAEFVGTVRVRNNFVVNTVLDIRVIERETGQRVRRVEARRTDNPREARATGDQVVIFEGEVQRERDARPSRVREASEVRKIRRERASNEEPASEDATGATNAAEDAPEATPTQRQRRQARDAENADEATGGNTRAARDEQQDNDAPAATPRRQRNNNTAAEGAEQSDDGEATPRQQRRRQRAQEATPDQPAASSEAAEQAEEPARKRRAEQRRQRQDADDAGDATGSTRAAPESGNRDAAQPRRRAQERRQQACDPAEPGCEPN